MAYPLSVQEIHSGILQARAYVLTTAQNGPSQQLIDFINRDGYLDEAIGLENFTAFSTQAQHEIILSEIPFGLEGLLGNIFKKAETAEARIERQMAKLEAAIAQIKPFAEKPCQMKEGAKNAKTDSVTLFDYFMEMYNYNLGLIKFQADHMPVTLNPDDWKKYDAELRPFADKLFEEYQRAFEGDVSDGNAIHAVKDNADEVELAQSGWSASSIRNASKKLLMWIESEQKFKKILDDKYESVKHAASASGNESESLKIINDALGYKLQKSDELSYGVIEEATGILLENIKYFEIIG